VPAAKPSYWRVMGRMSGAWLSSNFGQPVEETVEMMERFAAEVMPHLRSASA
jgi:hypothetical protein